MEAWLLAAQPELVRGCAPQVALEPLTQFRLGLAPPAQAYYPSPTGEGTMVNSRPAQPKIDRPA